MAVRVQFRCAAAALIWLAGHDCLAAGDQSADFALTDARIYTAGPQRAMAEALAVKDGRLVFVGRADEVREARVLETWFMGNKVYVSKGSDSTALKRPN